MSLLGLVVSPARNGGGGRAAAQLVPRPRSSLQPPSAELAAAGAAPDTVPDTVWPFNKGFEFVLANDATSVTLSEAWTAMLAKSIDGDTDTLACLNCLYAVRKSSPDADKDAHAAQCFGLLMGDERCDVEEEYLWLLSAREWALFSAVVLETAKGISNERIMRAMPNQMRTDVLNECKKSNSELTLLKWATAELKRLHAEAVKPAAKPAARSIDVPASAAKAKLPMVALPLGQDRIAGGAGAAGGPVAQFMLRQPLKQDPPRSTVLGSAQAESTWSVSDLLASEQALRKQLQLCNAWKTSNDAVLQSEL